MKTYKETVSTIEGKRRFTNLPGVEISKMMSAAVGNPQDSLKFVHIAGTNGKGSTAAFLCEIALRSGIKVGMFTSPHLVTFRERIRIGHDLISEEDVVRLGNMLLDMDFGENIHPTMFDYCFVMAMLYFKEQNVELVILETGLGGRLDSTNIIEVPCVSVITHIGYDHTAILGDTLDKIAAEKCGILKRGSCLVTCEQSEEAMKVIAKSASELGMDCVVAKPWEKALGMHGTYQKTNAGVAAEAARVLAGKGFDISEKNIEEGIANAFWPGRMQVISKDPLVIIDGAHNPDGVEALRDTIENEYGGRKFDFIMGVMADKDYISMLKIIKPYIRHLTTVSVDYGRAESASVLAEECKKLSIPADASEKTIKTIMGEIKEDTIVFGSLYFVGDIMNNLRLSCL
ncbi:MAG: bifunctional folylpolyglutamate synthase/dihydrofolate synthase [Lachnospiraceae bacterium]|nr:bifunctional folylpolyglutamate synthase/dihydrofolate synthase [Lachnospiraceae bacterium]